MITLIVKSGSHHYNPVHCIEQVLRPVHYEQGDFVKDLISLLIKNHTQVRYS